jgi:hypothetical protein
MWNRRWGNEDVEGNKNLTKKKKKTEHKQRDRRTQTDTHRRADTHLHRLVEPIHPHLHTHTRPRSIFSASNLFQPRMKKKEKERIKTHRKALVSKH